MRINPIRGYDAFILSLSMESAPPGISPSLHALWLVEKSRWQEAHDLVEKMQGQDGAQLHAYLHRLEGDEGNASYWYHRAGQPVFKGGLMDEWKMLVEKHLSDHSVSGI